MEADKLKILTQILGYPKKQGQDEYYFHLPLLQSPQKENVGELIFFYPFLSFRDYLK